MDEQRPIAAQYLLEARWEMSFPAGQGWGWNDSSQRHSLNQSAFLGKMLLQRAYRPPGTNLSAPLISLPKRFGNEVGMFSLWPGNVKRRFR
jgi:hypothetical protein